MSSPVATIEGQNIFIPESIQSASVISTTPKRLSSAVSGTYPRAKLGRYPAQVYGSNHASSAGYSKAKAAPSRIKRYVARALLTIELLDNYHGAKLA